MLSLGKEEVRMENCDTKSVNVVGREEEEEESCSMLVDNIRGMFETLVPPLSSSDCCIYRVPKKLRQLNTVAYTPQVISIGPFHHGEKGLHSMEKHKVRYLKDFLERANKSLEDFVSFTKKFEDIARRCYAEPIELSSDEFVKMILLDGGFIVEYLLRACFRDLADENDHVLYKPWLNNDIRYDLKLLENQLPFIVLEGLYNHAFPFVEDRQPTSFLTLTWHYFYSDIKQHISFTSIQVSDNRVKHFTDLLRTCQLPLSPRLLPKGNQKVHFSRSAVELHEAGVKFKVGSSKCLFDIQFRNGVLQIPRFEFEDETESFIRNLMAFEQCYYPYNTYICDYIAAMDELINTAQDVELLIQKGIIFNLLGDNNALANLVNNLCTEITSNSAESYFCRLCEDLNEYYKIPWHSWKAAFTRDYFSTPWRAASTVVAFILLVFTFMQTICSFISL